MPIGKPSGSSHLPNLYAESPVGYTSIATLINDCLQSFSLALHRPCVPDLPFLASLSFITLTLGARRPTSRSLGNEGGAPGPDLQNKVLTLQLEAQRDSAKLSHFASILGLAVVNCAKRVPLLQACILYDYTRSQGPAFNCLSSRVARR